MNNEGTRPFSGITQVHAPTSLHETIRKRVAAIERRISTAKLSSLVLLALAAAAAFVFSCLYVWDTLTTSGFVQYAALAFTDTAALAYIKDIALSLIESVPALGVALVLSAGLLAVGSVWSFWRIFQEFRSRTTAFFA